MPGLTDEEEERIEPTPHVTPKIDKIAVLVAKDGKIDKEEEKLQKARSALGNVYQSIEKDLHGNRKAVKLVRSLLTGTTDAAYDFMRTFMHLAHHFGLVPEDDLVDMANKATAASSAGGNGSGGKPESTKSTADAAPKVDGKPDLKVVGKGDDPISRHMEALKTGGKPPAPKGPPGDNDLADAGTEVAEEIVAQRQRDAAEFDQPTVTH